MTDTVRKERGFVYLHGFASHPTSAKAVFFSSKLRERGYEVRVPDLNSPSFETITLSAILNESRNALDTLPAGPVTLIGSSFGGLAALHLAARMLHEARPTDAQRPLSSLVLLSPALDFCRCALPNADREPPEAWEQTGKRTFQHSRDGAAYQVEYGLIDDVKRYDSYSIDLPMRMLIIHGEHDRTVPADQSIRYAAGRPNVELRLVNSDHSLSAVLDECWSAIVQFLSLPDKKEQDN